MFLFGFVIVLTLLWGKVMYLCFRNDISKQQITYHMPQRLPLSDITNYTPTSLKWPIVSTQTKTPTTPVPENGHARKTNTVSWSIPLQEDDIVSAKVTSVLVDQATEGVIWNIYRNERAMSSEQKNASRTAAAESKAGKQQCFWHM